MLISQCAKVYTTAVSVASRKIHSSAKLVSQSARMITFSRTQAPTTKSAVATVAEHVAMYTNTHANSKVSP